MTIAVVGTGYVGLVTGTCLAALGHRVTCLDIDAEKIARLQQGKVPIYEPGLAALVRRSVRDGRLHFTTSYAEALSRTPVVFIGVGTPAHESGRANLTYVFQAARSIARHLTPGTLVVTKSTVPVGTNARLATVMRRWTRRSFQVASCPEFLREGSAVRDFFHPDRIVIGVDNPRARRTLLAVFANIRAPKLVTDIPSAELIKYASNAFLATKISFINEIANVCERVGANVDVVAWGMGMDTRIGRQFLKAGLGYGGSCFPKDVRALNQIAGTNGYTFHLLRAVIEVNNAQRLVVLAKLRRHLRSLRGKRIGVLGLAFKQETDDVRESAAVDICRRLLRAGARVRAYDPVAASNAAAQLGARVRIAASPADVARGADALVVATEWDLFRTLNWRSLRRLCRRPLIVDGRNILNRAVLERAGFTYEGIGR